MKKALGITYAAATFLTLASSAFAVTVTTCGTGNLAKLCTLDFTNVIGPLVQLFFVLAIIAALLYLVWGGFKWLTSGGDKQAVASAREHIIAALIGLVIVFLSYFILNIVMNFFFGYSLGTFDLPTL